MKKMTIILKNGMVYFTNSEIVFPEIEKHEVPYITFYGNFNNEGATEHKIPTNVIKNINCYEGL